MYKTRLLLLADALETRIPREKFDLHGWRSWLNVSDDALLHECNTTGCAVGWACALPEFQAQGLHWNRGWPALETENGRSTDWRAVEDFFEISADEANRLFTAHSYPKTHRKDPLAVAQRIRELVSRAS